jgi:two-component system sensor histidine kinase DcuS
VDAIGDGDRREILVDLDYDAGWLAITVADTGPGIRPEHLALLFERGFSTKGGDRGYGLYHAAQRVALHGGRLEVSGREGGGTIFHACIGFPEEVAH